MSARGKRKRRKGAGEGRRERRLVRLRRWYLALGLFWIALAGAAVLAPLVFRLPANFFLGAVLGAAGIGYLALGFRAAAGFFEFRELAAAAPALGTALYLVLVRPPGMVETGLAVAAFLVAEAGGRVLLACRLPRRARHPWFWFAAGLALVLAVPVLLRWPAPSLWAYALWAGLALGIGGWSFIAVSRAARH